MKASSFGYVIRDGFRNIRRNKVISFASIATVAISLFLMGFVWLFILNVNNLITTVESGLEVNAYLEETVSREEGSALAQNIQGMPGVSEVAFITKEEALVLLEGRFSDEEGALVETIGEDNPLPDMIQIKATDPTFVPALAEKLENTLGVAQVRYGEGTVEKLLSTAAWVKKAGLIGLIGISIAAIILISTSIRITVFSREKEIEIMRLVGATNGYIRWPFIIEGIVIGLIGAIVSSGLLFAGYRLLMEYMSVNLSFIPLITDIMQLGTIFVSLIGFGALLGLIGSFISVIRYLNV